jgi:hypothetical protein
MELHAVNPTAIIASTQALIQLKISDTPLFCASFEVDMVNL